MMDDNIIDYRTSGQLPDHTIPNREVNKTLKYRAKIGGVEGID